MKKLIIIGCGPKAIAIATKAYVLNKLNWRVPEIAIIEKNGATANWDGTNGYTDGELILGTPPTEDVGFPYISSIDPRLNEELLKFSYFAYHIEKGTYAEWIDRNQLSPTHRMFADYFKWVLKKINQEVTIGEVKNIIIKDNAWLIKYSSNSENKEIMGDGLVITGPGKPYKFPHIITSYKDEQMRVYDGQNIWKHIRHFKDLKNAKIAVIGAGETAAAIVTGLLNKIDGSSNIEIITRHPMLFTRNENWIEVMYFSTARNWNKLSNQDKLEVIRHADQGTFSPPTKNLIDSAHNVDIYIGNADKIEVTEKNAFVTLTGIDENNKLKYDYVIEATGFDKFSFLELFEDKSLIEDPYLLPSIIEADLSVKGITPHLHLPTLAALNQGPGFPHLSCLGLVSDRILATYVSKNY